MPDIKFYLQKPREASSLILVAYTPAPNRRYRISTGQRAETAQWNKKAQRCRGSARFQGNAALNALLDRIQDALNVLDSESRLAGHGAPTKEQAVGAVRRATGREAAGRAYAQVAGGDLAHPAGDGGDEPLRYRGAGGNYNDRFRLEKKERF